MNESEKLYSSASLIIKKIKLMESHRKKLLNNPDKITEVLFFDECLISFNDAEISEMIRLEMKALDLELINIEDKIFNMLTQHRAA